MLPYRKRNHHDILPVILLQGAGGRCTCGRIIVTSLAVKFGISLISWGIAVGFLFGSLYVL